MHDIGQKYHFHSAQSTSFKPDKKMTLEQLDNRLLFNELESNVKLIYDFRKEKGMFFSLATTIQTTKGKTHFHHLNSVHSNNLITVMHD